MSAIFISHSSRDNAWAERIAAWLRELGHESLFLDFDPQNGIPAGRDWEKELHHRLRRCRAVIALCSEHFRESEWCIAEVAIASHLGKSLFPIRIGPCELPATLRRLHHIDLTSDPDDGFRRLARGLTAAGLDPKDTFQWDSTRPPYPGLMAFQEADAPVFFGRDQEIQEGLDGLRNLRRYGGKALLLVLGASGCGKSSLVRAGIVPRLRRDPENWLVLDPFCPRADPFAELGEVLANTFRALGQNPPEPPTTASELKNQLEDLHHSSGHREACAVVVIDQFEELLAREGSSSEGEAGKAGEETSSTAAKRFLTFLREVTAEASGQLVVLATLRSDFLGSFQCHPTLVGAPFDDLNLGPMEAPAYARVIEGPAEVAGLQVERDLTRRMLADTRTGDALPLLAFTLRELWERYGNDGDLTLTEYQDLGGLEASVQRAADAVLLKFPLNEKEIEKLKEAFLMMCDIDKEGVFRRRQARWEDMPASIKAVLHRFIKARLLVSSQSIIEISHEAMLRSWPLLANWLHEEREFLLWKRRTELDLDDWLNALVKDEADEFLLSGLKLDRARKWLERRKGLIPNELKEFIEKSISHAEKTGGFLASLARSYGLERIEKKYQERQIEYDKINQQYNILAEAMAKIEEKKNEARSSLLQETPMVFISYAHDDELIARRVYGLLKDAGFRCWFDKEALLPGVDWDREIRNSIQKTDFIVILLSKRVCNKRGYIQREIRLALKACEEIPDGQVFIVPVRIEDCEVPQELSKWQYYDLFSGGQEKGLVEALLVHWNSQALHS